MGEANQELVPLDVSTFEGYPCDVEILKKMVKKTFGYCLAKTNKSRFVTSNRIGEIKKYKVRVVRILRKRSEDMIKSLEEDSEKMI